MQIDRFLHTAILVTDLARAERFYGEVLGLSKVERSMRSPGSWFQVGDVQVHLILASIYPEDRVDQDRWGRNRHLAFAVTSVEAARQRLLDCGYACRPSASGRPALFVADPDGNIVELGEA